jgi:mannose-6-phosphate isomerase
VIPAPSRLAPIFVPRIWGARSLEPLFENPLAATESIGEVWLTGDRCEFASGPCTGRSLGEAWPELPATWTGPRLQGTPRIPLLLKFIFAEEKLSVQVHPDDDYARKHEAAAGGVGKTEMWYTVAAREGAELLLGLQASVVRESFQQAIAAGTVERHLKSLPVRAGDAFFVPAGTAHTIGPGMVLCEVQQHSDITYRVFDYHRLQTDGTHRPLHIRQALEVMRFGEQNGGKIQSAEIQCGDLCKTYLAACQHFAAEHWEFSKSIFAATSGERFELLILLSGHGHIRWEAGSAAYDKAQAWFFPAALGAYQLVPQTTTKLLRAYVPDLQQFTAELAQQGIAEAALSRLVHR